LQGRRTMRGSRALPVGDGTGLDSAAVGAAIGGRRVDAGGRGAAPCADVARRYDGREIRCSVFFWPVERTGKIRGLN
jgi:hypothetical protein